MSEFEYHNTGNSEAQEKGALSQLFAQSGAWMAATGVLSGLAVTQAPTANGTVLIASGSAVVQPTITAGASLLVNPSQKTLDVFTANPMGGLARNDIIEFDSLTALISVRVGVPNATPTDPTVPATSVALARLRNLASATTIPTAQIDSLQVATTVRGAIGANSYANGVPIPATSVAKAGERIHWGTFSGTTNASSELVITHGCGFTPTVVVPMNNAVSSNQAITVYSVTSTQATIAWRTAAGGTLVSTAVTCAVFFGE